MNAPAPRSPTARVLVSSGVAGLLLAAGLAAATPAGAREPVERDDPVARTTSRIVLVNGVHSAAGVAAKLERLRYAPTSAADLPSSGHGGGASRSSEVLAWSTSATSSCGGS